jgi:hypothetical protein
MAQVRLAIDVINGGSHIKTFAHVRDNVGQRRKLGNWQLRHKTPKDNRMPGLDLDWQAAEHGRGPFAGERICLARSWRRCVAQVSKPAVSPTSKSASPLCRQRVWKPATRQTWKSAPH